MAHAAPSCFRHCVPIVSQKAEKGGGNGKKGGGAEGSNGLTR